MSGETPSEQPPALMCASAADLDTAARLLVDRGWAVHQGFALPDEPWDLARERRACRGHIDDLESAAAATLALVRGCAAALVVDPGAPPEFLDDVSRCARIAQVAAKTPVDGLGRHEDALLAGLASGVSVREAAAALYLSPRSAHRRLATAREALGARTTRQAVLAWIAWHERRG